jgi:hypothetical protein
LDDFYISLVEIGEIFCGPPSARLRAGWAGIVHGDESALILGLHTI